MNNPFISLILIEYHVLHSSKLVRQLTTGLSSVNQAARIVRAGCEHFHKLVRLKPRHNTRDLYDCQGKHETQTTIVSKVCLYEIQASSILPTKPDPRDQGEKLLNQ